MPVIFIPKKIYAYATIKLTRLLQATLALLLITVFFSCKKVDTTATISKSNYAEKFFEKPATAPAELQAIIDLLKNENDKSGFVNRLPANAGLPVWEKLINEKPKPKAGCAARGIIADENGNYLIPLSSDDKTLSALLFAMNRKDTYEFYYYDNNYAYRIAFNDKYSLAKREYVMALFISMSNYVFGINEFKNIPKDLFTASGSRPDENGMANKITIVPTDGTPPKIFTNGRVVGSITNCGYQWAGQCNCRPNCRSTSCCDHPWGYCISNYCTYEKCYTIIFEEEDPPPGSGEGGG